ncbi:hypothetical protein QBC37DRAFT_404054 [Rhypophila decipiens]|uniref:Uncharacterized protein n=1 Tax=Rhypophila decipiens TaxID=261697 RepID=A0AAN6Y449_9PEZI|nr:hypothetical protein QBC37DRAFT_404054 [Rhypophila decipiens]
MLFKGGLLATLAVLSAPPGTRVSALPAAVVLVANGELNLNSARGTAVPALSTVSVGPDIISSTSTSSITTTPSRGVILKTTSSSSSDTGAAKPSWIGPPPIFWPGYRGPPVEDHDSDSSLYSSYTATTTTSPTWTSTPPLGVHIRGALSTTTFQSTPSVTPVHYPVPVPVPAPAPAPVSVPGSPFQDITTGYLVPTPAPVENYQPWEESSKLPPPPDCSCTAVPYSDWTECGCTGQRGHHWIEGSKLVHQNGVFIHVPTTIPITATWVDGTLLPLATSEPTPINKLEAELSSSAVEKRKLKKVKWNEVWQYFSRRLPDLPPLPFKPATAKKWLGHMEKAGLISDKGRDDWKLSTWNDGFSHYDFVKDQWNKRPKGEKRDLTETDPEAPAEPSITPHPTLTEEQLQRKKKLEAEFEEVSNELIRLGRRVFKLFDEHVARARQRYVMDAQEKVALNEVKYNRARMDMLEIEWKFLLEDIKELDPVDEAYWTDVYPDSDSDSDEEEEEEEVPVSTRYKSSEKPPTRRRLGKRRVTADVEQAIDLVYLEGIGYVSPDDLLTRDSPELPAALLESEEYADYPWLYVSHEIVTGNTKRGNDKQGVVYWACRAVLLGRGEVTCERVDLSWLGRYLNPYEWFEERWEEHPQDLNDDAEDWGAKKA